MNYDDVYKERLKQAQAFRGQPGQDAMIQLLEARIDVLKEQSIDEPAERKAASHAAIREIRYVIQGLRNDQQIERQVANRY